MRINKRLPFIVFSFIVVFLIGQIKANSIRNVNPKNFPDQFRNDTASDFLERIIENPNQLMPRSKLAELYSADGYIALSHLIRSTSEFVSQKSVFVQERKMSLWGCMEPDPASEHQAHAMEISRLTENYKFDEARRLSLKVLSSDSSSCRIAVEWCRAVLLQSLSDDEASEDDWNSWELALRWLIISAEHIRLYPLGMESKTKVYELASDFFSRRGDFVSAYVSLQYAIENLKYASELEKRAVKDRILVKSGRLKTAATSQR